MALEAMFLGHQALLDKDYLHHKLLDPGRQGRHVPSMGRIRVMPDSQKMCSGRGVNVDAPGLGRLHSENRDVIEGPAINEADYFGHRR
jgi:hypothetical protein